FTTIIDELFKLDFLCQTLSPAQKCLIYTYGYLYSVLKYGENYMGFKKVWQPLLEITPQNEQAIKGLFNEERIAYIKKEYARKGRTPLEGFIDPPEYLEHFVMQQVEELLDHKVTEKNIKVNAHAKKVTLKGLEVAEYEHEEDRRLLEALRGNKVIEKPLKLFVEYDIERVITVQYTGSNIKVTPQNIPMVYRAVETACRILDVKRIPDIYVQQGFAVNACTTGIENPIIILNAGCLSLLSYEELLFIVGHEVGHIKSQHLMYHMIGQALPYIGEIAAQMTLGIGGIIGTGLQISLYNWYRKSELTADRAGLLVCQNHRTALSALMKCAGYPPKFYETLNEEDFLKQVEQFESLDSETYNKFVKIVSNLFQTHPWTVLRAKELNNWYEQGAYEKIVNRIQ
ncbi:MAG: M48 family metallopeptidase, partial [Clostridium sp.]|nr:M48 family metallopeptidase [Clostridium sp.]